MAQLYPNTIRFLNNFCREFNSRLRDKLTNVDINASYNLYNSIDTHVITESPSGERLHYRIAVNLEDYWYYVENGRRAGSRFPPLDDIRHWVQIKPVPPVEDYTGRIPTEDQLVYLIGRKIQRDGIDPYPFMEQSIDEALERFYTDAVKSLEDDVVLQLNEIFKVSFPENKYSTIKTKTILRRRL